MKMHALSGGRIRMRKSFFYPNADGQELADLPVSCFLMRHPQGNVLFDTGCHPSVEHDGEARWDGLVKFMTPILRPGENVIDELARLSLGPDDIDVVINSHLHCDHCGCNEFFKNATFMAHANELETVRDPEMEGKGYFRADWDQPMPMETVDGDKDLFGDERIVIIPLPGHTPGLIGALANLDRDGSFLLAADGLSVYDSLATDFSPRNNWNAELFVKSLAEIRKIEAGGATILCGHDAAQWATLKKAEEFYD